MEIVRCTQAFACISLPRSWLRPRCSLALPPAPFAPISRCQRHHIGVLSALVGTELLPPATRHGFHNMSSATNAASRCGEAPGGATARQGQQAQPQQPQHREWHGKEPPAATTGTTGTVDAADDTGTQQSGRRPPLLYLASPLGFSETARRFVLPEIVRRLEALGVEVYEPFSTNAQNGLGPQSGNAEWALDIAAADSGAVARADAVFAVLNGQPPDEGVAVELGIAIALGKPTFLFRDDFRKCADSNIFKCNLMLYSGLPRRHWRRFLYKSIDGVQDGGKALAVWAATATRGEPRGVDALAAALDASEAAEDRGRAVAPQAAEGGQ